MKKNIFMLTVTLSKAFAQDTGLYDPAPPANSAFVRVIGAPSATLGVKAVTAAKGAASAYVVIPQGEFAAKVGAIAVTKPGAQPSYPSAVELDAYDF